MDLARQLKEARKAKGLSQEKLAKRTDVSTNTYNRLETGIITNPHLNTLLSIVEALDAKLEIVPKK